LVEQQLVLRGIILWSGKKSRLRSTGVNDWQHLIDNDSRLITLTDRPFYYKTGYIWLQATTDPVQWWPSTLEKIKNHFK
jgi:hypothetical protein